METVSVIIAACITVFAFGLFIVSLFSYHRSKNIKLLFVSLVFMVLLIRGILLSVSLFNEHLNYLVTMPYAGLLDLTILILLFIATLKR